MTKPLPVTIPPEQKWETFISVAAVPAGTDVEHLDRARLVGDVVIESGPRPDVPPAGFVP